MNAGEDRPEVSGVDDLDAYERAVLDILRGFCRSYSHPESQAWEAALDTARVRFASRGGEVAHAVMAMLREMRLARRTTFRFANPTCPCCRGRVTPHEVKIVRLLRALRQEESGTARAEALILCEGANEAGLVSAARYLAGLGNVCRVVA